MNLNIFEIIKAAETKPFGFQPFTQALGTVVTAFL